MPWPDPKRPHSPFGARTPESTGQESLRVAVLVGSLHTNVYRRVDQTKCIGDGAVGPGLGVWEPGPAPV